MKKDVVSRLKEFMEHEATQKQTIRGGVRSCGGLRNKGMCRKWHENGSKRVKNGGKGMMI